MARSKVPLTPERASAVVGYFERALRTNAAGELLREGGTVPKALVALNTAVNAEHTGRAATVDQWLLRWISDEGRQRCFAALRQSALREARGTAPRRRAEARTWNKVRILADNASVSLQQALEGLVDYVLDEPRRRAEVKRLLVVRGQLLKPTPKR